MSDPEDYEKIPDDEPLNEATEPPEPDEAIEEDTPAKDDERQGNEAKQKTPVVAESLYEFNSRRARGKVNPEAKKMSGLTELKCPHQDPDKRICKLALDEEYCRSLNTTPRSVECTGGRYQGCSVYMKRLAQLTVRK